MLCVCILISKPNFVACLVHVSMPSAFALHCLSIAVCESLQQVLASSAAWTRVGLLGVCWRLLYQQLLFLKTRDPGNRQLLFDVSLQVLCPHNRTTSQPHTTLTQPNNTASGCSGRRSLLRASVWLFEQR